MMTLADAKKKAEEHFKESGLNIGSIMDDGKYFIFGYDEEVDISPLGVNKNTGEVIEYFPPDHMDDFANAIEIENTAI